MNKLGIFFRQGSQLYLFALFSSVLISLVVAYHNEIINPDGICYLLSAQTITSSSLKEGMHFCPQAQWPLYSSLISGLVQISHFSYSVSAQLLNAVFSAISVMTFILIAKELGGSRRVLWLAALVILLDHQFNVLRDNITRDHGFWAFYLISIYCLLRYFREHKWTMAFAWNLSLLVATLFRIEGAVFLLVLPWMSWFNTKQALRLRAKSFFILNAPLLAICVLLALAQLSYPGQISQHLGRVNEVINQAQNGWSILAEQYQASKNALIQHVLPPDSVSDASSIMLMVLISWYFYNVLLALSCAYAALLIYAWFNRARIFSLGSSPVLWGYVAVNFILTLAFLAEHLFISKRYLVAFTLVLALWLPFALNDLIDKWQSLRHRLFLIVVTAGLSLSAISGIVEFGYPKFYIRTAGNWIAENVPANASLYVNDFQLMYYTQHFGMQLFEILPSYLQAKRNMAEGQSMAQSQWEQYDYLALRVNSNHVSSSKDNSDMLGALQKIKGMTVIQVFNNKRGDRVLVYKLNKTEKTEKLAKIAKTAKTEKIAKIAKIDKINKIAKIRQKGE
jgi:hypothetical protein